MDKEELKEYLKNNLSIRWVKKSNEKLYLCLLLEGEEFSNVRFEEY